MPCIYCGKLHDDPCDKNPEHKEPSK